jgi:hypothetical protein
LFYLGAVEFVLCLGGDCGERQVCAWIQSVIRVSWI